MGSIRERVNSKGKPAYSAEVRLKGYPPQRATFARKTDAKKWVSQVESGIREGRHFTYAESKKYTLAETIDRYLQQVAPHVKNCAMY